ncbi:hypothetical protein M422DRAFT_251705 [Sphaerobolus stellatus SS14]|uniref:Uncharacterized protein n=1 Tax=Sphaerobolus stellatus (strain SS14) TaxID=990650 RepID=A0A0C9UP29_SPHS4|nr:hypothetical protein M422DRAFT_251705 [Sphaerobolus stellatus SS14]
MSRRAVRKQVVAIVPHGQDDLPPMPSHTPTVDPPKESLLVLTTSKVSDRPSSPEPSPEID